MDISKKFKGGTFGSAGGRIPERKASPPPPKSAPGRQPAIFSGVICVLINRVSFFAKKYDFFACVSTMSQSNIEVFDIFAFFLIKKSHFFARFKSSSQMSLPHLIKLAVSESYQI